MTDDGQMGWDASKRTKGALAKAVGEAPCQEEGSILGPFFGVLTNAPCMSWHLCFYQAPFLGAFKCRLRKMPFENGLLYSYM